MYELMNKDSIEQTIASGKWERQRDTPPPLPVCRVRAEHRNNLFCGVGFIAFYSRFSLVYLSHVDTKQCEYMDTYTNTMYKSRQGGRGGEG